MKRSIVGAVLAASLLLAPFAFAETTPVPIGNPLTDTLQLWSDVAATLSSLAQDFASIFDGREFAAGSTPSSSQQESASIAAAVVSFATIDQSTTSAPSAPTTATQPSPAQSNSAPATPDLSNYVTQSELNSRLADLSALSSSLEDLIAAYPLAATTSANQYDAIAQNVAANGNPFVPYAGTNNITNLSGVTISNSTIDASSLPDLSGDYLSLNGGTLSGAFFDSSTTSSSFTGALGIGTTSPFDLLSVAGNGYLSGSLNVGDATTTRSNLGLSYASDSDIFNTSVVTWGDSLTAGNEDGTGVTYPKSLSTDLSGRVVTNEGVGGQTSTQIGVREGGVSTTATISGGQIPASGGVTVTFPSGYEPVTSQGPSGGVSGTISGVYGTVTLSGSTYTFTRSTAGSIVNVSSATFVVDTGTLNNGTVVIWAGRNDLTNVSQVESDIAAMVSHLGSNTHYLILSVLNEEGEPTGSTNYNDIASINAYLASTYPGHYFDIREWLVQNGLSQAGIATSSQDQTDYNDDIIPTDLRYDAVHLNGTGYGLVAQQVANFITGTLDTTNKVVLQPDNLSTIFASPFPIGSTAPSAGYFTTVGIGTTSPADTFDVKGTLGLQAANAEFYTRNGNANTTISFDFPELSTAVPAVRLFRNTDSTSAGLLQIFKADGTGNTIQTQLSSGGVSFINASSGNVAIGTTSASDMFDVNGNIGLTNSTSRYIYLRGGNSASQLNIDFPELTSATGQVRIFRGTNTTANSNGAMAVTIFKGDGSGSVQTNFGANSTSYINALSGNVGIGTTAPYARLSVWGIDTASSTPAFNVVNSASTTLFAVFDGGNAELSGTLSQSSDQRLKTNIQSLNASSSLLLIDSLNPVTFNWIDPEKGSTLQLGFIAQQVQKLFPNLVSTTSPTALTPDGTLSLNYIGLISPIVSAIQEISTEIASIENTLAGLAELITSARGTFTNELCVGSTCVTPAQFQAMAAAANASQSSREGASDTSLPDTSTATETLPVIQINGSNPAIVQIGDTYNDLGATIIGPTADLNLGIKTFLNGALVSNIVIDSSAAATDTIDYVATDQSGFTSTSTRMVIIEPAAAPSIVPTDDASTTTATSYDDSTTSTSSSNTDSSNATTTDATTTVQ